MKNAAVEAMMRKQYNLKNEDYMDVEFKASIDNEYEFEITYSADGGNTMRTTLVKVRSYLKPST